MGVTNSQSSQVHERWAHFRFSVIGQLLAAPPPKGELRAEIEKLASQEWRHPITGGPVKFGFSTIERWYRKAAKERLDPVSVLRRKPRANVGEQRSMSDGLREAVLAQYAAHKSWSMQLHYEICLLWPSSGLLYGLCRPTPQFAGFSRRTDLRSVSALPQVRQQERSLPRRVCSIARCAAMKPSTSAVCFIGTDMKVQGRF